MNKEQKDKKTNRKPKPINRRSTYNTMNKEQKGEKTNR
jgi:hypothetical protein